MGGHIVEMVGHPLVHGGWWFEEVVGDVLFAPGKEVGWSGVLLIGRRSAGQAHAAMVVLVGFDEGFADAFDEGEEGGVAEVGEVEGEEGGLVVEGLSGVGHGIGALTNGSDRGMGTERKEGDIGCVGMSVVGFHQEGAGLDCEHEGWEVSEGVGFVSLPGLPR